MSLQSERIQLLMKRLSLTEMAHGYEALAEQAAQKNLPYCDFLEQVLEHEANVRQERNIKVRTQLAGFQDLKRLEQFDFKFPTSIDEKKIRELASLRFLERHENAVFLGPPGVGKTHLAVSLGMEAIRHGFSVYFVSLPDLLDRLVQAQAENRMRRKMSHLRKCRLLSSRRNRLPQLGPAGDHLSVPVDQRTLRTRLDDSDVQQELRRVGLDLSGQRDRQRDSRSSVAPLPHHQHQGRKLS